MAYIWKVSYVVIYSYNLHIVDYTIEVPGSLHDSIAFQNTQLANPLD